MDTDAGGSPWDGLAGARDGPRRVQRSPKRSSSITLVQAGDEVARELRLRVARTVDLGDRAQLGVEPNTRSTRVAVQRNSPWLSRPSKTSAGSPTGFQVVPASAG